MKTKIQIKSYLETLLFEYEDENNTIKNTVEKAIKEKIDLSFANLRSANLRSADLSFANLRAADLRSADLGSANLSFAKNINKFITTPLYFLLDQPNPLRAYKLVNKEMTGIFNGGLEYTIGKEISIENFDKNEKNQCGPGINLATLDWCLKEYKKGYKILICEFNKEDIVAIPIGSDGKFRVKKCRVIKEKPLKECGL